MLKSLAIGLLTLTATCSTAAFAGDGGQQWQFQDQDGWLCAHVPFLCGDDDSHHHHHHHHRGSGGPVAAPEIDAAGAIAALSLLAGGLAVMRGRRSSRKQTV